MFCLCSLQFLGIDVLLIWENRWNHIMLSICLRSNIKYSFYLLTWDETLGAFLCSALYNPANLCEGHCYKSVNKPPNSKSICWQSQLQSWAAEPHLCFPPGLPEFGTHCVGDISLSRTRVCCSSADPPFLSHQKTALDGKCQPCQMHSPLMWELRQLGWRCRGTEEKGPAVPGSTLQPLSIAAAPWQHRAPSCAPALQESGHVQNREVPLQMGKYHISNWAPSWFLQMPMTIF